MNTLNPRLVPCLANSINKSVPHSSSFPRSREGGFTFQVQQFMAENLCRGLVIEAFSRSVIIAAN